ncbi:sugar transferase [Clostridium sp. UBA4395]|uniref:sugar transferase n=1 Tax=Clostridium sp. UBA4395 TaxID=1946360 RepID=UPI003216A474
MERLNLAEEHLEIVDSGIQKKYSYKLLKRFLDIALSVTLIGLTSPIIILALIIVYLQDFNNPVFIQKRVGIGNREFKMYKIRSMIKNAESEGAKWADINDCRITKFGKFARKTRIDELPQLFNIIKGDMSLIGPRPEREIFYRKFEKDIPNFRDRLKVKPGLTGWAQVNGGYDIGPSEKLELDLYYIENLGFKIEGKIFIKTIKVILTGLGAR